MSVAPSPHSLWHQVETAFAELEGALQRLVARERAQRRRADELEGRLARAERQLAELAKRERQLVSRLRAMHRRLAGVPADQTSHKDETSE